MRSGTLTGPQYLVTIHACILKDFGFFRSEKNTRCNYTGLVAFHMESADKFRHKFSLCDGVFKHRNIYSETSAILLVIYSYREYGTLNVTVGFSTTSCKLKIIDICTLYSLCAMSGLNKECIKFRKESFDFPNPRYSMVAHNGHFQVNVPNGECLVVQLLQETGDYTYKINVFFRNSFCQITVLHQHVKNEKKIIKAFSTGHLSGRSYISSS